MNENKEIKGTLSIGGPFIEGIKIGKDIAEEQFRIEAFGAIRRAAEVARSLDAAKCENDNLIDSVCYEWQADSVRRAIRAAIGSDKA